MRKLGVTYIVLFCWSGLLFISCSRETEELQIHLDKPKSDIDIQKNIQPVNTPILPKETPKTTSIKSGIKPFGNDSIKARNQFGRKDEKPQLMPDEDSSYYIEGNFRISNKTANQKQKSFAKTRK